MRDKGPAAVERIARQQGDDEGQCVGGNRLDVDNFNGDREHRGMGRGRDRTDHGEPREPVDYRRHQPPVSSPSKPIRCWTMYNGRAFTSS